MGSTIHSRPSESKSTHSSAWPVFSCTVAYGALMSVAYSPSPLLSLPEPLNEPLLSAKLSVLELSSAWIGCCGLLAPHVPLLLGV